MTEFPIKQNDTAPAIQVQLLDSDKNPINFDSISTVSFSMYSVKNDETVISKNTASIFDADESVVVYNWNAGDTEILGHHKAEFEVEYKNGDTETFPNSDNIDVYITEEIQ